MSNSEPNKVELLAPAGNFAKLETVLYYGADAVYLSGSDFSLRNFAGNFSTAELAMAIQMAHECGVKAYVAVNIFARQNDLEPLSAFLRDLAPLGPDGVIVADPAVLMEVKRRLPYTPIHLSTQANTTNAAAAKFWHAQGVRRINAARELSLAEITEIAAQIPDLEIEAFVHGSMCISYSGRCLLSNFMARRPGNQGMCCQPCRFRYFLVEETRPGQYFPIQEDDRGSYILNSKDLCMLAHLPQMIRAGIRSLKIEGRMKGIHYAATVVKIYREAIDAYYADPDGYTVQPYWQQELDKITGRGYGTGFYLGGDEEPGQSFDAPRMSPFILVGNVVEGIDNRSAWVEVRNRIRQGDRVEILNPKGPPQVTTIGAIWDREGNLLPIAQSGSRVRLDLSVTCHRLDLLRGWPAD